jgi:SAM-dependent methyltransferase
VHALCVFDENQLEKGAVALIESALADTQQAFDSVASGYERSNAANPLLAAMRARALEAILAHTPRAARLLDLGCGPGADAAMLAAHGHQVTAIDWSNAMVEETRARAAREGVAAQVDVHHLGIQELDRLPAGGFKTVYSNFGALNCVPDLAAAIRLAADRIVPGGVFVASVIGRVCPWEIALFASRADFARVAVRFARDLTPVPLNGRTVWTRYYTPSEFERVCAPFGLRRVWLRALGVLTPPPYMEAFAARQPAWIARLQGVEDRAAAWPGIRNLGDHFLMVLKKS